MKRIYPLAETEILGGLKAWSRVEGKGSSQLTKAPGACDEEQSMREAGVETLD